MIEYGSYGSEMTTAGFLFAQGSAASLIVLEIKDESMLEDC